MAENKIRIGILDGFRCIAILMVILFHYYTRWTAPLLTVNYYPFGSSAASWFKYGYLGVHFFFIISGFVIFYTLEKSRSLGNFFIKRFIRLFPPMLLCSVVTFFAVKALDPAQQFPLLHSNTALNFFPSLTFSHPIFWIKLFHNDTINYIDGSYWSLWVEITFYLLSGVLFFLNKEKFIRNWSVVVMAGIAFKIFSLPQLNINAANYPSFASVINIVTRFLVYANLFYFLIYFTLGIYFYCLFFKKKMSVIFQVLCLVLTVLELISLNETGPRVVFLLMIIAFLVFIYKPQMLAFMNYGFIARMGVISYTLYLIHQHVGVVLINKLSTSIQSPVVLKIIPLSVLAIIIVFAEVVYRLYERPVMTKLHAMLSKI